MSSTLVTGSTGTVGFNIVNELVKRGRQVRVMVRDPARAMNILPDNCEIVQGDITDAESVKRALQGCDIVHHSAGLPEQWFKDPDVFTRVNVQGTQNMLDAAFELGVKKFVYTSTIDVFEARSFEHYDESILDPNPKGTYYERSKQQADKLVVTAQQRGLDVVFIHPSAVYGPSPDVDGAVGVNAIITKVKRNEIPVLLPGGFPVVYSEDVGKAHVEAEQMAAGSRYIVSDRYVTLTELVSLIHSKLDIKRSVPKVMPVWVGKLIATVGEFIASIINKSPLIAKGELTFLQWQAIPIGTKAAKELAVEYVQLEDGLDKTIALMQDQK